ncbi:GAP family protein [Streptomyces sp. NPDC028722]|uniref:GAP family protein n=1 Tax=Streptomyces sp. NPDC028722 TaxID=3155016 RepID=UPI0033EE7C7B
MTVLMTGAVSTCVMAGSAATRVVRYRYSSHAAIDRFTPLKILGLGLALSAANAKNAPLTIAAGASISSAGIPVPQQIETLAIFVIIASEGILAPLAVYLLMGDRAKSVLSNWRDWATRHNVAVMAVLFFVLGLKLLGDGIGIVA